jgi:hypothetical protein
MLVRLISAKVRNAAVAESTAIVCAASQVLERLNEHIATEEVLIDSFGGGRGGAVERVDGSNHSATAVKQRARRLIGMMSLRR